MSAPGLALVGLAASAGGVPALVRLVQELPQDLPAAVVLGLHLSPASESMMSGILERHTALRVLAATDRLALRAGTVVVTVADHHLLVVDGEVRLGTGPAEGEGAHRPSHDAMLRSIAVAAGPRAVGVVLTGLLEDGSAGLACLERWGGQCFVQQDAEFASMPDHALAATPSARSLPLDQLAAAVQAAVRTGDDAVRVHAQADDDRAAVLRSLGAPALPATP